MIYLQNNSPLTIHDQLVQKISDLIINGALVEGEKLPSVRKLATELVVNPQTINKAYVELEKKGLITCIKNKGYFVNKLDSSIKNEKIDKKLKELDNLVLSLLNLGVLEDEIYNRIKRMEEKND